ncbi:DNA-binding protein [Stetteria hydrogenophila]
MALEPSDDAELEEIRRRKLLELQRRLEEERRRREQEALREAQREALLRRILTERARSRLTNVRLVKPELAEAVENYVIQLVQAGRLQPPVGEDIVIELLARLDSAGKREPRIRFKRK